MLATWLFTVLSEMNSSAAISWLVRPAGDGPDDLHLPIRQPCRRPDAGRPLGRQALEQPHGDRGGDQGVAGVRGAYGLDEQGRAGVLEHEADGPARSAP